MEQATRSALNRLFLTWLLIANLCMLVAWNLNLATPLSHWLGSPLLWSTLIPLGCLVLVNPARTLTTTIAAALGLLLLPVLVLMRCQRHGQRVPLPGRPLL